MWVSKVDLFSLATSEFPKVPSREYHKPLKGNRYSLYFIPISEHGVEKRKLRFGYKFGIEMSASRMDLGIELMLTLK